MLWIAGTTALARCVMLLLCCELVWFGLCSAVLVALLFIIDKNDIVLAISMINSELK